jgi:hypothetical protein
LGIDRAAALATCAGMSDPSSRPVDPRRSNDRFGGDLKRPAMWRGLVVAALVSFAAPSHAINSQLLREVSALPTEYRIVQRCGEWRQGDRVGYHRVVVGDVYNGAGSELYVQWIEQSMPDRAPTVVKTLAVRELNDDHGQYDFESVDCEQRSDRTTIRARATYEHDEPGQVHDISIQLLEVGKYRLSQSVVR